MALKIYRPPKCSGSSFPWPGNPISLYIASELETVSAAKVAHRLEDLQALDSFAAAA